MATLKNHGFIGTWKRKGPYERRPDASRTLIYYPLTSNLVDQMGNGNTGTMTGTCTFDNTTGIHVTGRSSNYVTGMSLGINNRNTFTLNFRFKYDDGGYETLLGYQNTGLTNQAFCVSAAVSSKINIQIIYGGVLLANPVRSFDTNWHNACILGTGTSYKIFLDNVEVASANSNDAINNISELQLGWGGYYGIGRAGNGYIKDYIVENYARTEEDRTNYYNRSKEKLGL